MVSRLQPLLIAGVAAAALGCGSSGASAPRTSDQAPVAAVAKSHARIWAVGDSAGGANAAAVARLIRRNAPDKVLYLGDIYNGADGLRAFNRLYGDMPVARTPGNHDWPQLWAGGPEWYSFTAGGWRILALNSETSHPVRQLTWLRSQLRARGDCRLAFWHRPRWSGGLHGDTQSMNRYWQALEGHARLVVSGHDHDMQRFAPRGTLTQLVSGAGGYSHYPVNRSHPGLEFADDRNWGAVRIELARGRARIAFVGTSGRVLDAHSSACRA